MLTGALTDAAAGLHGTAGVGGEVPESVQGPNGVAEAIGALVAFGILLLVLRSVLQSLVPFVVAAAGVGVGTILILLLANLVDISLVTPTLAAMIGIGVSIDYALLIISRHRRELADGTNPPDAAGRASASAGHAVLSAGAIVVIGLSYLLWSGMPGFAWMGAASSLVVIAAVVAAITLVPALLGVLGHRVRPTPERVGVGLGSRVRAAVVRRPVAAIVGGALLLTALALPALGVRLAQNDAGSESSGNRTRVAYDLVASGFGPGHNGPLSWSPTSPNSARTHPRRQRPACGPGLASRRSLLR